MTEVDEIKAASDRAVVAILEASDREVAAIKAEFRRELMGATIALVVFLSLVGGWYLNAR